MSATSSGYHRPCSRQEQRPLSSFSPGFPAIFSAVTALAFGPRHSQRLHRERPRHMQSAIDGELRFDAELAVIEQRAFQTPRALRHGEQEVTPDRKSTRLNSSHVSE